MLIVFDILYHVCIEYTSLLSIIVKMISFKGKRENCIADFFLHVHKMNC